MTTVVRDPFEDAWNRASRLTTTVDPFEAAWDAAVSPSGTTPETSLAIPAPPESPDSYALGQRTEPEVAEQPPEVPGFPTFETYRTPRITAAPAITTVPSHQPVVPVPTPVEPAAPVVAASVEPPASSFTRGLVSGLAEQNPQGMGDGLEAISYVVPAGGEAIRQGAQYLKSFGLKKGSEYARQNPSFAADPLSWIGENVGAGAASTVPSLAAGAVGTAVGSMGGPWTAFAAGMGAAAVPSYLLNLGDLYSSLKEAGVADQEAARTAVAGAVPITALDVWGLEGALGGLTRPVRKSVMDGLARRIVKQGLKGGIFEGGTEGLQQVIQESVTALETGKWQPGAAGRIVGSAAVGTILGVAMGGPGGAAKVQTEPQAEPVVPVTDETGRQAPGQQQAAPAQPEPITRAEAAGLVKDLQAAGLRVGDFFRDNFAGKGPTRLTRPELETARSILAARQTPAPAEPVTVATPEPETGARAIPAPPATEPAPAPAEQAALAKPPAAPAVPTFAELDALRVEMELKGIASAKAEAAVGAIRDRKKLDQLTEQVRAYQPAAPSGKKAPRGTEESAAPANARQMPAQGPANAPAPLVEKSPYELLRGRVDYQSLKAMAKLVGAADLKPMQRENYYRRLGGKPQPGKIGRWDANLREKWATDPELANVLTQAGVHGPEDTDGFASLLMSPERMKKRYPVDMEGMARQQEDERAAAEGATATKDDLLESLDLAREETVEPIVRHAKDLAKAGLLPAADLVEVLDYADQRMAGGDVFGIPGQADETSGIALEQEPGWDESRMQVKAKPFTLESERPGAGRRPPLQQLELGGMPRRVLPTAAKAAEGAGLEGTALEGGARQAAEAAQPDLLQEGEGTARAQAQPSSVIEVTGADVNRDTPLWHGTKAKVVGPLRINRGDLTVGKGPMALRGRDLFEGAFASPDPEYASMYAMGGEGAGIVQRIELSPDARVLDLSKQVVSQEVLGASALGRSSLSSLPKPTEQFPFQNEWETWAKEKVQQQRVNNGREPLSEEALAKKLGGEFDPTSPDWNIGGIAAKYFEQFVTEKGYDAVRFGRETIILNPRAATATDEEYQPRKLDIQQKDAGTARAQAKPAEPTIAPTFYSAVERAADKLPNRATPQQILATIQKTPGVKAEELDYLDLPAWLEGQRVVEKAALLDYVRAHNIQVEEVVHGQPEPTGHDMQGRPIYDYPDQSGEGNTKFADDPNLTLRGAEPGSQRELLMTLPVDIRKQQVGFIALHRNNIDQKWFATEVEAQRFVRQNEGWRVFGASERDNEPASGVYRSSHWDEPNVLAHIRFNDRTDADGQRVMFVEEVQSDWHQAGRRQGYRTGTPANLTATQKDGYWEVTAADGHFVSNVYNSDAPTAEKAVAEAARRLAEEPQRTGESRVPDAPFKTTWPELAMKRALRWAAENGYDRLAWTTGEQQADRYSLSKQVDAIIHRPDGDGTYQVSGILGNRSVLFEQHQTPEQLEGIVGKEIAQKIVDGQGRKGADGTRKLAGLDLKVGGEGMAAFYDHMLPNFLNKYAKKWGARVGETSIEATDYGKSLPVHSLDITPSLRDAVLQGQPLFQAKDRAATGTAAPPRPTTRADALFTLLQGNLGRHWTWERTSDTILTGKSVGGLQIAAQVRNDIPISQEALAKAYPGAKPGAVQIAGAMDPRAFRIVDRKTGKTLLDGQAVLYFSKNSADRGTLRHEPLHLAAEFVLTKREKLKLLQQYREPGQTDDQTWERIASAYETWEPGKTPDTFFDRIYDWFRQAYEHLAAAPESTFRKIESGKVWERAPQARATGPGILQAGNATVTAPGMAAAVERPEIKAFHGTPHTFEAEEGAPLGRFHKEKVGTGEGAAAYGWGVAYLAEVDETAENYKRAGVPEAWSIDGQVYDGNIHSRDAKFGNVAAHALERSNGNIDEAIQSITEGSIGAGSRTWSIGEEARGFLRRMQRKGAEIKRVEGNLYHVEILAESHEFLDWDKPLSEQSAGVRAALAAGDPETFDPNADEYDAQEPGQITYMRLAETTNKQAASEYLSSLGIKGIRYLDQGSRTRASYRITKDGFKWRASVVSADGRSSFTPSESFDTEVAARAWAEAEVAKGQTYNYVVFDEKDLRITGRNGEELTHADALAEQGGEQGAEIQTEEGEGQARYSAQTNPPPAPTAPFELTPEDQTAPLLEMDPEKWYQQMHRAFVDKFARLAAVEKTVVKQGGTIPDPAKARRAAELYVGRASDQLETFNRDIMDGRNSLMQRLTKAGHTVQQLGEYLYAKHAAERNAHVQSINPDFTEGGAGLTDVEAAAILARYQGTDLDAFATEFYDKVTKKALQIRLDAGLISQDTYDTLTAKYANYVPLKGKAGEETYPNMGKGFSVTGKDIRRAKGRRSLADNPAIQALVDYEEAVVRAEKNKVSVSFAELARGNPSEMWEVQRQQFVPHYDENGDMQWLDPQQPPDNAIVAHEAGKVSWVVVKDKGLLEGMKNMGIARGVPLLRNLNVYLRAVNTTLSPAFVVNNFFRDLQTSMIHLFGEHDSKTALKVLANLPGAMRGIWRNVRGKSSTAWANEYAELKAAGGKVGWFDQKAFEEKQEEIKAKIAKLQRGPSVRGVYQAAGELITDINEMVESGVRLASYKTLKDRGVDKLDAGVYAKNLSVNFNTKGQYGEVINSLWLFSNASIQGTARIFRAMGVPGRPKTRGQKRVQALVAGMVTASFVQSMVARSIDPDDWADMPDYVKDNYWLQMMGNGLSLAMKVPYGYNIFIVLGRLMEEGYHQGKEVDLAAAGSRMVNALNDAFNPLGGGSISQFISPTFSDPLVQWVENKNFAGQPLRPDQPPFASKIPDSQLYFKSVRPTAKWLSLYLNSVTGGNEEVSGKIDVSPELFDLIIESTTGSLGKFVANSMTTTGSLLKEAKLPAVNMIPMVREVVKEPQGNVPRSLVFDILGESGRTIYSPDQQKRFHGALQRSVKRQVMTEEKAAEYREKFDDNQMEVRTSLGRDYADLNITPQARFSFLARKLGQAEAKAEMGQDDEVKKLNGAINRLAAPWGGIEPYRLQLKSRDAKVFESLTRAAKTRTQKGWVPTTEGDFDRQVASAVKSAEELLDQGDEPAADKQARRALGLASREPAFLSPMEPDERYREAARLTGRMRAMQEMGRDSEAVEAATAVNKLVEQIGGQAAFQKMMTAKQRAAFGPLVTKNRNDTVKEELETLRARAKAALATRKE